MNCADVRQRLLLSERPDKPGPEESRHLAKCVACQNWLRRLVILERKITELHVPSCPVPMGLLEQINAQDSAELVRSPMPPSAKTRSVREVGRQKLALAFSLAATLTLFTLAWWAWPPRVPPPPTTTSWTAEIERRKQNARTSQERVTVLVKLVDELLTEMQSSAEDSHYVGLLANDFEHVTSDLLITAQSLPATERPRLREVAEGIAQAESRASRLAAEWQARQPETAQALKKVAKAAGDTMQRLRELTRS